MKLFRYRRQRGEQVPEEPTNAGSNLFAWADDPAANPIAPEVSDLTAIAGAYSRVQVALASEQSTMDRTRKNELWEEIMRNSPSATPTAPILPLNDRHVASAPSRAPGRAPGSAPARSRGTSHPRVPTRHQGTWQIALNAGLVVVLLLGITGVIWNRDFFDRGGGGNGSDTRPQLAMSGPTATPGGTGACDIVSGITQKAKTRFASIQQGEAPPAAPRSYSPAGPTASRQFNQLGAVYNQYRKCAEQIGSDQVPFPIATDRYIWEHDNPNLSAVQLGSIQQQQHDAGTEIARSWTRPATLDASLITVGPFYPLQPDTLQTLQDGRIGAIVYKRTSPVMKNTHTAEAQALFVPYFIAFKKIDAVKDFDIISIDELFPLCDMRGCPSGLVPPIIINQPSPVPGSTPAASPIASPVGVVNNRDGRN